MRMKEISFLKIKIPNDINVKLQYINWIEEIQILFV